VKKGMGSREQGTGNGIVEDSFQGRGEILSENYPGLRGF